MIFKGYPNTNVSFYLIGEAKPYHPDSYPHKLLRHYDVNRRRDVRRIKLWIPSIDEFLVDSNPT